MLKTIFLCGLFFHNDLTLSRYCLPWKQTCTLQFPLNSWGFLRVISPKIKEFFVCLFTRFYVDLSAKCRMKGKWSLTTMILNNLYLWIPAPLRTDLTEEQRNLGLVVRQGGCWTRGMSVWFQAFQATFLLFSPAEEILPKLLKWTNFMLSLEHQSVFSYLFW